MKQRIIKFRAWSKKTNCLYYDITEGSLINKIILNKATYLPYKELSKRIIIMQYTGLKDKNNVEIYEGDIVRISRRRFVTRITIDAEIQWTYCGFNLKINDLSHGFDWNMLDVEKGEVVGNIYENPELIKGENNETND